MFRCYIDYANHGQMVRSSDGLVNLANYTLFIAELMLAHKACRNTTCVMLVLRAMYVCI